MPITRNKLYAFMGIACSAGYGWLYYNYTSYLNSNGFTVCIFKNVAGIPCPSCGSTRAVESILHGNVIESLLWNPFGVLLIIGFAITPIWLLKDIVKKDNSLYRFYQYIDAIFKRKKYAIPAIVLVLLNWAWNIYKDV